MSLFDYAESKMHRDLGMEIAAENNATLLVLAREIAVEIARCNGTVTADDVVFEMSKRGHGVHSLGNAAGSLFRDRRFEWTGGRTKSIRIHAHANEIKVWKLK